MTILNTANELGITEEEVFERLNTTKKLELCEGLQPFFDDKN